MNKNKIILGTVQFGLNYGINNSLGKPSQKEVFQILNLAKDRNIDLLDTAEAYGNAQNIIGSYHKQSNFRFNIITKYSPTNKELPLSIYDRVYKNLDTLNVQKLYSYMFHSFKDYKLLWKEQKKNFEKLKEEDKIEKIGVSLYTNEELKNIIKDNCVELVQIPFNLLDNVNQKFNLLKEAKEMGFEIHTRSAFLQGLFFRDIDNLPDFFMSLKSDLKKIKELAKSNKISVSDLALSYVSSQKYVDGILIGVDSETQLSENINFSKNVLPQQVIDEINSITVLNPELLNPSNWK
ncbi:MAG: aldo/keto reductase [Cyclobacteriaceae bacterium]|nr:aldo/keto reductase [Cyclobacteriaceae bacterium]